MTDLATHQTLANRPRIAGRITPRHVRRWLAVIGLVLSMPAVAAPALEYGPEAERRFHDHCDQEGTSPAACQALMERLQARFGYEAFLERAEHGPGGFWSQTGGDPNTVTAGLARQP
jgi:hypothetical protein